MHYLKIRKVSQSRLNTKGGCSYEQPPSIINNLSYMESYLLYPPSRVTGFALTLKFQFRFVMEIPIHRIYEQFQRCHRQRLGIRERSRVHLEVRGQIATGEIQVARIISISGINLAATIRSGEDSTCHSNRLRLLIQTEYLGIPIV